MFKKSIKLLCLLASAQAISLQADTRDANALFDAHCFSCHGTGWQAAPVIGDSFAWEERRAKGMDVLLQNTLQGLNAMPPKGSCSDCTEDELLAIIQLLIAE